MVVRFGLEGDGVQVAAGASYEALREYTIVYHYIKQYLDVMLL